MKRVLVITVAGTCSRFNKELQAPVLKCLYSTRDLKDSILFRMIQLGKNFIVCVVDRDAKEISLYMDGVLVKSNSIPDDFGAVVPSATESQFGVTTSTYLSRFAFWPRALSAEEVAIL